MATNQAGNNDAQMSGCMSEIVPADIAAQPPVLYIRLLWNIRSNEHYIKTLGTYEPVE